MITFIVLIVALTLMAVAMPFLLKLYYPHNVSFKEVAVSVSASMLISAICIFTVLFAGRFETEILNGEVLEKRQVRVACEHSYQVCVGSGEDQICSTHYEHSHDYDWRVFTSAGDFNINRVDSRGTVMPPRFSNVEIGEHAAIPNSYIDYLKGQKESLLYRENMNRVAEFDRLVPSYPAVYDYYRANPVIFSGLSVDGTTREQYNQAIRDILKKLGPTKQVNVVVVFANTVNPSFGEYLRNEWKNGRKNDQIVVIGMTQYPNVEWVYSFGWSKNEIVNTSLRMEIQASGEVSPESLASTIDFEIRKHFIRLPMSTFKTYLWTAPVSVWLMVLVIFIQLATNVTIAHIIMKR